MIQQPVWATLGIELLTLTLLFGALTVWATPSLQTKYKEFLINSMQNTTQLLISLRLTRARFERSCKTRIMKNYLMFNHFYGQLLQKYSHFYHFWRTLDFAQFRSCRLVGIHAFSFKWNLVWQYIVAMKPTQFNTKP